MKNNGKGSLKSIEFSVEIAGNGLVNFNGGKNTSLGHSTGYDNAKYAKEHVYNINGELEAKKIISSNLLRKEILGSDTLVSAQLVLDNKALRSKVISDRKMLMRGWMFAGASLKKDSKPKDKKAKKGEEPSEESNDIQMNNSDVIRRKSPISIIAAEQIDNNKTTMEFCTSRDMTTDTSGETKKSSTSIYTKETIGDIKYRTLINVNMIGLQLMSFDDRFDRMACKEDELIDFIKNLNSKGYTCEKGNYFTNSNDMSISEQCIKFDEKFIKDSLLELVKNTINLNIVRSDAFAKTSNIGMRLLFENDDVILNNNTEYININSVEEFSKIIENIDLGYDFIKE